jgi:hypothetical protein
MLDSFDIGFDDGVHAAVHLVPRHKGDGLGRATGTWVNGTHPAMLWAWAWERFS